MAGILAASSAAVAAPLQIDRIDRHVQTGEGSPTLVAMRRFGGRAVHGGARLGFGGRGFGRVHRGQAFGGGFGRGGYYGGGYDGGGAGLIGGLAAGAIIGGAIAAQQPAEADPDQMEPTEAGNEDCSRRFRSYDPASGSYLGYDGLRHACPQV
jgi:hypothetical protein